MKKATKALALLMALLTLAALLGGCAKKEAGKATNSPTPTDNGAAAATNEPTAEPTKAPAGDGKVYKINIDYPNSENSAIYPVLKDWEKYVEENSGNRIDVQIYSGGALGSLFDCVSNCESGVTDGFWSGVTIYAGVFPNTEVMGLPMLGAKNQLVANAVLKDLYYNTDYLTKEWSNLHLVALHSSTASPILFANKAVDSADDMKGMNLRISNAYTSAWFEKLGANPVSCSINEGYENIQKGVIEGGLFFFDQVQSSELYEVIDSIVVTPTIYPLTMFCLNKDVYAGLPDDLKKVIDDSGEYFLSLLPDVYNKQYDAMIAKCEEAGVKVVYADDAFVAALQEAAKPAWDKWVETMNSNGYDGQAVLNKTLELIDKYNKQY